MVVGKGGRRQGQQLPCMSSTCHWTDPLLPACPCLFLSPDLPCSPPPCRVPEKSLVQNLALGYWSFHYVKRLLETFFVHK